MSSFSSFKKRVKAHCPVILWSALRILKSYVVKMVFFLKTVKAYFNSEPKTFKYRLAITAIIKNEGRYIEEWIKYHVIVGVEKFYLYDNESTDNTKKILEPYVKCGLVDFIYFPGEAKQHPAYIDALKRYKNECEFMAVIDGDEFIRPMDKNKNIYDIIKEIMLNTKVKRVVGIVVPWKNFGSSGYVKTRLTGGVLGNFTHRQTDEDALIRNNAGKTICNPRKVITFVNPHFPYTAKFLNVINENGDIVPDAASRVIPHKICIHHYFTKSKEEYIERRSIGKADSCHNDLNHFRTLDEFYARDFNDVYDDSMLYYVEKIKDLKLF